MNRPPPMRIVYLHQYFVTPRSAGGTRSYEMARRLVAAGHQVDMITAEQNPVPGAPAWRVSEEAGITVHWANVAYDNSMGFLARLRAFVAFAMASARRAANVRDSDVIFATSTPLTIALPAMWAAWRRRIPYVFEVRDVWPAVPIALGALRNPLLRFLARRLEHHAYHRAAHVVALAPGMADEVARTGYDRDRITVIPNGCDNDIFATPAQELSSSLESARNWLEDRPLILFAGTLGLANGVGYVAQIAQAMLVRDPDIRFAIIGSGRDGQAIADQARELGVLDVNLLMVPAIPKAELAAWIQRSQICLALFSGPAILWKDAVQNKFFDALSAGKPVVSNHEGWQCHIAVEHDVGFAMASDDPEAAAEALASAARDRPWLEGVAARARALATGRFDRDKLAAALEQTLARVVSRDL